MLHVFTEERSAQKYFESLITKILTTKNIESSRSKEHFRVYGYGGKDDLRKSLKTTIPSISKQPNARILITIDQDSNDCRALKEELEQIINGHCHCHHKIRIVCRELESWLLGDLDAIAKSYPRFKPEQYRHKADFKNVDKKTKPSDTLLRIIPDFKDLQKLPKITVAEKVSQNLDLNNNTSTSFNLTVAAINELISI